jgi:hypothetical protein
MSARFSSLPLRGLLVLQALLISASLAAPALELRPQPRPRSAQGSTPATKTLPPPGPSPAKALRNHVATLPPAPDGVKDLFFDEFFRSPVGPKGLDLTERLASLNGERVRILGYMVQQSKATPWTLLLAPLPLISHETEFGLAEDLPASTVRVVLPRSAQPVTPHTPGLLLLTGRLEVGDREEADGRHSLVRLIADPPPKASVATRPASPLSAPETTQR